MSTIRYHTANVDGLKIFYREAGPADAPDAVAAAWFPDQQPHVSRISSLCLPIASTSLRRTCRGSDNPICRRTTPFRTRSPSWPK